MLKSCQTKDKLDLLIHGYLTSICNDGISPPVRVIETLQNMLFIAPLITFPSQLSPLHKRYLIFGFLRNGIASHLIPELIKVCVLFYDEVYHWVIPHEKLLLLDVDARLYSAPFSYHYTTNHRFTFKYLLHKRVNKFTQQMVLSKHIEMVTAPARLVNIAIYSEISCPTNGNEWKSTRVLSMESKDRMLANIGSITVSEVTKNEVIVFDDIVKILRMNVMNESDVLSHYAMQHVQLNIVTEFHWTLSREYVSKCKLGQTIFSPNSENNTFTMQIRPLFRQHAPNCLFGVRLLALPKGVKKVLANVDYMNNNMAALEKLWLFSYNEAGMGHIMEIEKLIGNELADAKVFNSVVVTVHRVFGMDNKEIEKEKWNQYGIS